MCDIDPEALDRWITGNDGWDYDDDPPEGDEDDD